MRTTLTLDDDVARRLRRHCRTSDKPFKEVVNTLLRKALTDAEEPTSEARFQVHARSMGLRAGFNLDNLGDILDRIAKR